MQTFINTLSQASGYVTSFFISAPEEAAMPEQQEAVTPRPQVVATPKQAATNTHRVSHAGPSGQGKVSEARSSAAEQLFARKPKPKAPAAREVKKMDAEELLGMVNNSYKFREKFIDDVREQLLGPESGSQDETRK